MTQTETVNTSVQSEVAGVIHAESKTADYEVNRYSGEYDVIYKPLTGFKYKNRINDFTLDGANVMINSNVTNFFNLPEFYFVKYSDKNILDLEQSEKYEAQYPLINETPIDKKEYNILSSSWDFNYHQIYQSKSEYTSLPGTRRLTEDYSFVSKLLNLPISFIAESFNIVELTNQNFEIPDSDFANLTANGSIIDIAYSIYETDIKLKINLVQIISKKLITGGLNSEFLKFFKDEYGQPITSDTLLFGELNFDQYISQYCQINLVKLYMLDRIEFYEKADHTLPDNTVSFSEVPYSQLDDLDYAAVKNIKINNTGSSIISGSINKKLSSGVNLVPKLKIKYI